MKHIYIVLVCFDYAMPKVSQEAYTTLEQAQDFIEGRSDAPKKLTDFKYESTRCRYVIQELTVKEK